MDPDLRSLLNRYQRTFVDIDIRSARDGRTICGIAVPYGVTETVDALGTEERFEMGAFARTIAERGSKVRLLSQHSTRENPLGRATLLREEQRGLYAEFKVSRTAAGDEALTLVEDGALDAFSVGFTVMPGGQRFERNVRVITEARLHEVSLVTFPAYAGALVTSVRAVNTNTTRDEIDDLRRRLAIY